MRQNLAAAAAILAVVAVALLAVLLAGSGTLLYAAEGNTNTSDHADPSSIAVMTTEEAETILPLMGDIIGLSYDSVYQLTLDDPEYAARYLAAYDNSVSRLGTNLAKIKLTSTDINTYKKESAALGTSIQIVLDDITRLEEIEELKKQYAAEGNIFGTFSLEAESLLIKNELTLTAISYAGSAAAMQEIAENYGLDPTKLLDSVALIKEIIAVASSGSGSGSSISGTDTSGSITLAIYPDSGYYGDKLLVTGIAKNTGTTLSIYWDTNIWGTVSQDSTGTFSKSMTIGRIFAGTHAVTVQSDGVTSKPVYITILSRPSVVTILKAEQTNGELHRLLTLYGTLRTDDDTPVVGAPVTVYSEDNINIGTGTTNANGIWNVSAELIDGGYAFYAVFDDPSFPLEESTSDLYPVTILDPTIYYILLIVVGGVLLVLVIRFVRKRKPKTPSGEVPPMILGETPAAPGPVKKIRDRIFKKEDTDPDQLRRIYKKTAAVLAATAGIENVAVLTPRELLASLPSPTETIQEFITTYEYLHYANVSVSFDQIKHLERLAKQIIEGYYEK